MEGRSVGQCATRRMVVAPALRDGRHHSEAGDSLRAAARMVRSLDKLKGLHPVLPTFNSCRFQQGFSLSSPHKSRQGGAQSGEQDTEFQTPRGLSTLCPGQLSPPKDTVNICQALSSGLQATDRGRLTRQHCGPTASRPPWCLGASFLPPHPLVISMELPVWDHSGFFSGG